MTKLVRCGVCEEAFSEYDDIINVHPHGWFHERCVDLFPTNYAVWAKSGYYDVDGFLGTCDEDDKNFASYVFEEGEYLEDGEEEDD
ncbi:hypothetical protein RRL71_002635 [Listeria monocytogenes]|uniref:hypothetical protein n=1 Tax=Listeria monocytogenes TaxID=1639 RepID=UPI000D5F290E|nr:hypothetical protein [Listeria monocytogenes]EAC4459360.1 hypothetical protein [Listeria monocytogenes]EAE7955738.1 hypothetical protein [Listeria monocytogenes]EAF7016577.1 hypothetical protein [Listeria monocytogenes]EAG4158995.1 hypothetical protein [Listeria monocytogenes]EDO0269501.1 hypothetical protein [Listeria monocytogenes]